MWLSAEGRGWAALESLRGKLRATGCSLPSSKHSQSIALFFFCASGEEYAHKYKILLYLREKMSLR